MYQRYGCAFRYVHDLKELLAGLRAKGLLVPDDLDEAASLTSYAHAFRYPGIEEPVTKQEYEHAVALAEKVLRWAESQMVQEMP